MATRTMERPTAPMGSDRDRPSPGQQCLWPGLGGEFLSRVWKKQQPLLASLPPHPLHLCLPLSTGPSGHFQDGRGPPWGRTPHPDKQGPPAVAWMTSVLLREAALSPAPHALPHNLGGRHGFTLPPPPLPPTHPTPPTPPPRTGVGVAFPIPVGSGRRALRVTGPEEAMGP